MKSIHITAQTLPFAWEKAVVRCWELGEPFPTEYDKPDDPHSRDVTAMIHVIDPMQEPRIHRGFPGGLEDLEKYRLEVLHGVHDHWINPAEGKWEYTYHERLRQYKVPGAGIFDQIEKCIEMLKKCGYTRRAQATTWQVWNDIGIGDPACLQRLWFRVQNNKLNMNIHIRSNDAFKAGFMNMYAFVAVQEYVASRLGIEVGEYIHIADSFHIYGSYFEEFQGFLNNVDSREAADRVYSTEFAAPMFAEGCDVLLAEEDMPEEKHGVIHEAKAKWLAYGGTH